MNCGEFLRYSTEHTEFLYYNKILAVHYFKIIDSYVEKIIQQLIEIVEESKHQ